MNLDGVSVGTRLPTVDLPLDRTTIVATAIASQDFEDVHHDPGAAEARGTPDIFMSINATNGFVDRYVTEWSGAEGRILRVSLRLGEPNFPGDTMTMDGEVTSVEDHTVVIRVTGCNPRGVHVTADVALTTV